MSTPAASWEETTRGRPFADVAGDRPAGPPVRRGEATCATASTPRIPTAAPSDRATARTPETASAAEHHIGRWIKAKTQQKISGRLRSEQTTRDRYAIRGYISTAAKHGAHVLTAIHDALAGTPWIPPIPEPP
jgi:hypothetical protein